MGDFLRLPEIKFPQDMHDIVTEPVTLIIAVMAGVFLSLIMFKTLQSDITPPAAKGPPKPSELRDYTRAQVAQHCREDDAWLTIKKEGEARTKVYDVTSFVDQHPGGESILKNVGGDATKGFYGPQHPPTVFDVVDEYLIGYLVD